MSDIPPLPDPAARLAKAPFADSVLICAKCAGKLGAGGKAVRKALKTGLKRRRPPKLRLIQTRCLSVCPKGRIVLASSTTLARGRMLLVEPGFEVEAALDRLLAAPEDGAPALPKPRPARA